jgi:hypothetical protein
MGSDSKAGFVQLLIGAGGIYAAFLYYGTLQEEVFHYKSAEGQKFTQAWFLQALGKPRIHDSIPCFLQFLQRLLLMS